MQSHVIPYILETDVNIYCSQRKSLCYDVLAFREAMEKLLGRAQYSFS